MIAKKCASCHQPSGSAPFALLSYADARRRGTLIRYVGMTRRMPPTEAYSDFGPITEHPALSDQDVIYLQGWVRDGLLEGSATEPITATSSPLAGAESLTTTNAPPVRSEGAPYRSSFRVTVKSREARNLRAFRVIPKQPRAVRQVSLAIAAKEPTFTPLGTDSSRLIGAWAPGYQPWRSERGVTIPAETEFEVQVLYQPTGKAEDGNLSLELVWDDASEGATWVRLGERDFMIPARDLFTTLTAETTLEKDQNLVAIYPEARKYFNSMSVQATRPDGSNVNLLNLVRWDAGWVGAYNFPKPVSLPKGTKIRVEGYYNNSGHAFGELRTTPTDVKFGPGPNDELFWVHLQLETPR